MTKNNKKKKTAREKRILVGAFLTAVVIAAGSTFAWFTSSDTVTNRLSANADYNVAIAESFAPPKNWLPGQAVDKDVYAVNTGSIEAFVKATISGRLSVTREEIVSTNQASTTTYGDALTSVHSSTTYTLYKSGENYYGKTGDKYYNLIISGLDVPNGTFTIDSVGAEVTEGTDSFEVVRRTNVSSADWADGVCTNTTVWNTDTNGSDVLNYKANADLITLNEKERYIIEAGSYLAYAPTGSSQKPGKQVVYFNADGKAYDEDNPNTVYNGNDVKYYTDFRPDKEGLYVFRRSIGVVENGYENFEYDGYYYRDGLYYKVANLTVTSDNDIDRAGDKIYTDGNLSGATADFVKLVTETVDPVDLTYEPGNHRLVAKYNTPNPKADRTNPTTDDELTALAAAVDEAQHKLAAAQAALDRAYLDSETTSEAVQNYNDLISQLENRKAALEAKLDQLQGFHEATGDVTPGSALGVVNAAIGDENSGQVQAYNTAAGSATTNLNATFGDNNATLTGAPPTGNDYTTINGTITIGDSKYIIDNGEIYSATVDNGTGEVTRGDKIDVLKKTGDPADYVPAAASGTLKDYRTANEALQTWVNAHGNEDYIELFLDELFADDNLTGASGALNGINRNDPNCYAEVVKAIGYDDLKGMFDDWAVQTGADPDNFHDYYQLLEACAQKEALYKQSLTAAENAVNGATTAAQALGKVGTQTDGAATVVATVPKADGTEPSPTYTYTPKEIENQGSGLYGDKTELEIEITNVNAQIAQLTLALTEANTQRGEAAKAEGATGTAANNLNDSNGAIATYKQAYKAYEEALQAYNKAANAADVAAASELTIYINLANDVDYGGVAKKWQMTNANADGKVGTAGQPDENVAEFYYTSILGEGEVSEQLVESLELASNATQDTYKYFDFDLDINLTSAQILYDADDTTIKTDAAKEVLKKEPVLANNKDIKTAITWPKTTP